MSFPMAEPEADLSKKYDAVIIGSGAAGGMAAHVLTTHGLQVLLLEAGKKLDIEKELRSMQWPYDNAYRGGLPPGSHSISFNEYTIRRPPFGPGFEKSKNLYSYIGNSDYTKNIVVNERDNPYTGTNYAWVRARCLGGKTNIWGRLALRLSDYDFKAKDRDGFGENWPISYSDIAPYYDKVDLYLGITGVKENLPYLPDSIFQRPTKLNCAEVTLQQGLKKMGRVLTQYRAGVTTDGLKHNKYRSRCYGRGACERKGGCDIHAAFDSPTGLIYPAMDTGNLTLRTNSTVREITVDPQTGKASGVHFTDSQTMKDYTVRGKVVIVAASTLESARLLCSPNRGFIRTGSPTRAGTSATIFANTSWDRTLRGRLRISSENLRRSMMVGRAVFIWRGFAIWPRRTRISSAATDLRAEAEAACFRRARTKADLALRSRKKSGRIKARILRWARLEKFWHATKTLLIWIQW